MSKYLIHTLLSFGLLISTLQGLSAEDRLEIDFTLVEGRILIDGHLSGHDGVFIFDTGTPEIIINDRNVASGDFLRSVQGNHPVAIKEVDFIRLADYTLLWGSALLHMDLSELVGDMDQKVLGILGWSAFDADQPIFINYRDSKIIVGRPEFTTDMLQSNHVIRLNLREVGDELPTVEIEVNQQVLTFAFDTGAPLHAIGPQNMDQTRGDVFQESIKIEGAITIKENQFRVEDMEAFDEFDGILSVNALNTNYVVIDRRAQRVYLFWDEQEIDAGL
jgi:hypothetical protein